MLGDNIRDIFNTELSFRLMTALENNSEEIFFNYPNLFDHLESNLLFKLEINLENISDRV